MLRILDKRFRLTSYNSENLIQCSETLKSRKEVLELGVGLGNLAKRLLEEPDLIYYGIDVNPESIAYVQEKLKKQEYGDRLNLKIMNARNLQFSENSFDGVVVNNNLNEIGHLEEIFRGVYKVLRKKGIFVIAHPSNTNALIKLNEDLITAVRTKRLKETEKDLEHIGDYINNLPKNACVHYAPFDFRENLRKAGFKKRPLITSYYNGSCDLYKVEK